MEVGGAQSHCLAVVPQDLRDCLHEGLILPQLDPVHIMAAQQGHTCNIDFLRLFTTTTTTRSHMQYVCLQPIVSMQASTGL